MALAKTVTKIMPTKNQIGVHLKLEDDDHPITEGMVVVIYEDITDNYSDEPTVDNRAEIAKRVQKKIDEYKSNKEMYLNPKYTNAVTWVSDNTEV